jgi:hypothetical protein
MSLRQTSAEAAHGSNAAHLNVREPPHPVAFYAVGRLFNLSKLSPGRRPRRCKYGCDASFGREIAQSTTLVVACLSAPLDQHACVIEMVSWRALFVAQFMDRAARARYANIM